MSRWSNRYIEPVPFNSQKYIEPGPFDLGAISYNPLGHAGDGEYGYRPIQHLELGCKGPYELSILVEGVTEEGTSGFEQQPTFTALAV